MSGLDRARGCCRLWVLTGLGQGVAGRANYAVDKHNDSTVQAGTSLFKILESTILRNTIQLQLLTPVLAMS